MIIDLKNIIDKKNYILELKSVPLRIWTKDWPIPSKAKLEKYSINFKTSHKTDSSLIRYMLLGLIENAKEFDKRTYKNHKPNQWGRGKKSHRRFDYKILKENIWIKLLLKSYFFKEDGRIFSFDGNYLRLSLHEREMAIWYKSRDGQIRFVISPRFIEVDDKLLELIGFLDGEMSKKINKTGGSALKVSNAEPMIIKEIIKRFNKYFHISPDSWTASLVLNNKSNQFYTESDSELKDFWSEKIGLSKSRFTKTTFQKKYKSLFSPKGIIQIRYSNTLFFLIFLDLMNSLRSLILSNKDNCASYIRGIAAAEGGIGKRNEKLRIMHIGGTDEFLKDFYKKCLIKIGIDSIQTYKLRIEICGLRNFMKLYKINIFKYQTRRNNEFKKSLELLKKSRRYTGLSLNDY